MQHDSPGSTAAPRAKVPPRWTTHRQARVDTCVSVLLWTSALLVTSILVWILADVLIHGLPHFSASYFWSEVLNAGRSGGIGPILISTLLILFVTMAVSVPLGLASAIALTEAPYQDTRVARLIRRALDVQASVPSIVFGLFGNALFCVENQWSKP